MLPGGMAKVFLAADAKLGTLVVIKTPDPILLREDPSFAKRFQIDEIPTLINLINPHVVRILDVGEHQGLPFYVMQNLPGGTLEGRRQKDGRDKPLPMRQEDLCSWLELIAS